MTLEELTDLLSAKRIEFRRDGDELLVDGPNDELTDELIAEIRRYKPALLERAPEAPDSRPVGHIPDVRPAPEDSEAVLSFAQQRIWYLDQLEPGKPTFNLPFAYRISGPLDVDALERCFEIVVRRHRVLGSTFVIKDGVPVHVNSHANALEFDRVELDKGDDLENFLLSIAVKPFDLETGPLLRVALAEITAGEWGLLVVAHHTIFDGASIEILEREIADIYPVISAGREYQATDLPVQYTDYSVWQAGWLQGATLESLLEHWLDKIDGQSGPLNFPIDFPYPPEQTYNGDRVYANAPGDVVLPLRELAARNSATLFMVLIAAYLIALRRFCGEKDITIGIPAANRTQKKIENLIGFFANTLPIRQYVEDEQTVGEFVAKVRETVIDAIAHSEMPFERLVESLNPPRDLARAPIFQSLVSYQEGVTRGFSLGDVTFEKVRVPMPVSRLDISLFATESDDTLDLVFEYNTDVFERATAERFAEIFRAVLDDISSGEDRRLDDVALVREAEADMLLDGFNDTDKRWLPARIEHLVRQSPAPGDKIAIEYAGRFTTFESLQQRSHLIAAALRGQGTAEADLVGIYLPRSDVMLTAMLGVMKVGAGYLPLDPEFPRDRLAYMLSDSGAQVVITDREHVSALPEFDGQILTVDDCLVGKAVEAIAGTADNFSPDTVAYVLYTSGSTGRPKGVVVPQRCVTNFLASMRETPGIGADDVLLSVTTASFDISVLEFFLPLCAGATVVMASAEELSDASTLVKMLDERGVTIMQATPSTWRMLIDAGWQGKKDLKALCGGEPLPPDLARELVPRTGELWNMYGPTETTIWSSCCRIEDPEQPITIGTPIANTRIYVLDEQRRLLPAGVRGEIWIGGAGVTDGYLNREELTAASFVVDPFCEQNGARMYRTGDLGRWRPDGLLQHLGRIGNQVKIRGYRIELGEIESVLIEHDDVRAAACRVWQPVSGDQRLVAYVVPEGGHEIRSTELRKLLRTKLPDYMIPQHFESIGEIPLTPNGKIDRKALPAPAGRASAESGSVPPETDAEIAVAAIWEELIGIEGVGRHDHFFDLGGHSLLAVRVASEMEKRLGRRPHLREFILDDLAEIAGRASGADAAAPKRGNRGMLTRLLRK